MQAQDGARAARPAIQCPAGGHPGAVSLEVSGGGKGDGPAWSGILLAILLVGGCLNGFAARGADGLLTDGILTSVTQMFGISPFEMIIAAIAAESLSRSGGQARGAFRWKGLPALAFCAMLLVPIGLLSWIATMGFSLWAAAGCRGAARRGALLTAGLAACAVWWSLGERSLGESVMSLDATATAWMLSMVVHGVHRVNNLVTMPWGHSVVVLITCSTAYGMPLSVLSMVALATRNGVFRGRRVAAVAVGLALAYTVTNVIRLSLLAWSGEFYHIGHGPIGMGTFDALATILTLWAAALARRGSHARQ